MCGNFGRRLRTAPLIFLALLLLWPYSCWGDVVLTDQEATALKQSLQKAKSELMKIIGGLTGEMTTIFAEQFELIRKAFQETFLDLFGGGQATLELEDPQNILDCGIEIKVQPPGKTLKTITLLSGGEKAFVAIALYFALLKVHPTPFPVSSFFE